MKKIFGLGLLVIVMWVPKTWAEVPDNVGAPQVQAPHLQPVNVPSAPMETVTGSVTVRLNGVAINAQSIDYIFAPEFPVNTGRLLNSEEGMYFLKAENVPKSQPYRLTISASYNDSIKGRDGVIEVQGQTYTGLVSIDIPYGDDYDFGVRFIDLH